MSDDPAVARSVIILRFEISRQSLFAAAAITVASSEWLCN